MSIIPINCAQIISMMKSSKNNLEQESFLLRAANEVQGIKTGPMAMQAAGIQTEFATVNVLAAQSFNSMVVLRSGSPPVYNKQRSPKSGLNTSKTSNQGFFKGALAADVLFTRLENDVLRGIDPKDTKRLNCPIKTIDYQHLLQLPVNMLDIIRETGAGGDLEVLAYDDESGQLRLGYKAGKGAAEFKGQFAVHLKNGVQEQLFYSRPWDNPANQPDWDKNKNILNKPQTLSAIPDEIYERFFHCSFPLFYSLSESTTAEDLKPAMVFANTPRTGADFLTVMGESHPEYHRVKEFNQNTAESLAKILAILDEETIASIYDQSALIVAGDWDGLLLSHPLNMAIEYQQACNTSAALPSVMFANMNQLREQTEKYLEELKQQIENKTPEQLSPFDRLILSVNANQLITPYTISRAGCITPHEFLFQQLINYAYRDQENVLGEPYNLQALQTIMDSVLEHFRQNGSRPPSAEFDLFLRNELQKTLPADSETSPWRIDIYFSHLKHHAQIACNNGATHYKIPHPQHDQNIHDLYQHGFDMRNPYGCNIEGAWLMITPKGEFIYGDSEEQLIQVLLVEKDFYREHQIDVNPKADLEKGWNKILKLQEPPEPPLRLSLSSSSLFKEEAAPVPPPRKAYETPALDQNRVTTQEYRQQMEQLQQQEQASKPTNEFNPQTGL